MLNNAISAELELRRRRRTGDSLVAPADWQEWCYTIFPGTFKSFANRHVELWEWVEAIQPHVKPKAFIGLWGRGGGKSTNAETAITRLGSTERRKFGLYVSSTQLKADSHVNSISSKLESATFRKFYRKMSRRAINQYGTSKGWRRELLRCDNGFTLQSFGLDTGLRGIKVDDYRPDFIVIDDVDELHESVTVTMKKERIITDTILPSGSSDCAVLFVQNLIHPDSIASRLYDGRADFLRNRILSGLHTAIDSLAYEQGGDGLFYITAGNATWDGQDINTCQEQINEWGISAFLRESQHQVEHTGGIWDHVTFINKTWEEIQGKLIRVVVWVDPAVTSTDNSDSQGISCAGTISNNHMVMLYAWEGIDTPHKAIKRAIYVGIEYGAEHVGVETDNGGDAWKSVYQLAAQEVYEELKVKWANEDIIPEKFPEFDKVIPKFVSDKAGHGHGSKVERNARMLTDYEKGMVSHMIGTHTTLEKALRRFPNPPLDLADSFYYCWFDLLGKKKVRLHVSS